jgi:RNA polymerase sigma-70 factor (ECF subfamily)
VLRAGLLLVTKPSDADTVAAAWRASSARLRGFFARRVGENDADDLVQETFLRVHEHLDALVEAPSLAAWVGRIARNVLADHARRGASATASVSEPDELVAAAPEPDLERTVAGWLDGHISELDPADAALLRRVDLEGASQTALAAELGLTPSGLKSRVQRARARLRERLEACCRFDFDARGGIRDYEKRRLESCGDC